MRTRYIRNQPARRDDVKALALAGVLAAGVGALAFYVTRLLLARERMDVAVARQPRRSPDRTP